jgi:hypothetical protein
MFKQAYVKLDVELADDVIARVNPLYDGAPFDPETATVLSISLPFYPGYWYAEITHHGTLPPRVARVVYNDDRAVILTWGNDPIYALNRDVPIALDAKNVTEYVQFFFAHVRGTHGRFILVDTVDDIDWKEDPPPSARKSIAKMITPLSLTRQDELGTYILSASMMFKDALFQAHINVRADGTVTLTHEELLVGDMPVLDDTLGQ